MNTKVTKMEAYIMNVHLFSKTMFLIIGFIGFCTIAVSGVEAVQEPSRLELVKTYQSEEDVQAAYPELFPENAIREEGEYINFYDLNTKELLKQIRKEKPKVLREEKRGEATIVWERLYDYQVSNDHVFLLYTEYERGYPKRDPSADPPELRARPQKRVLYNLNGEKITELPREVNIVQLSPDKQQFLAMGFNEEPLPYVYVYSIEGTLLKTLEFDEGPGNLSFSQNGKFIQRVAPSGRKLFFFSTSGELLYEADSTKLNINAERFYNVFISNDGMSFLLETPMKIYLFSIKSELLWEFPSSEVMRCYFDSERRILQLLTLCVPSRKGCRQLEIRSLDSGELLDKIEGVSLRTRFGEDITVIYTGGKYYEYTINQKGEIHHEHSSV